jgi:hypothetical protein
MEKLCEDVSLYSALCMHLKLDVSGCEGQGTVCIQEIDKAPTNMQRTTLQLFRKSTSTILPPRRLSPRFFFPRILSQTPRLNMSSDQEYANFLEKANQDTGSSSNEVKTSGFAQTKAVDSAVPKSLKSVDAFYQSDTDEPFEPVALKYGKQDSIKQGQISKRASKNQVLMSHRHICRPDQPFWRGGRDQRQGLECQEPLRRSCRGCQESWQ